MQNESLPKNLRSVAFGILRRISGKFRKLPQSYLIEEGISTDGEIPYSTRGISTLWTGRLDGNRVAIKMLRLGPEDNKVNIATVSCELVHRHQILAFTNHSRDFARKFSYGPASVTQTYFLSVAFRYLPSRLA